VPSAYNVILDLSQVDFVASMGIRMLVSAARTLRQRQAEVRSIRERSQIRRHRGPSRRRKTGGSV
jgi:anti-anti-sigma factor